MKNPLSSFIVHIFRLGGSAVGMTSFLVLLFALCSQADQWIIDGRKIVIATDPQAARNFGTNTVYDTTNAIARWVSLTNGLALEVHSSTGWVRQVEYTED